MLAALWLLGPPFHPAGLPLMLGAWLVLALLAYGLALATASIDVRSNPSPRNSLPAARRIAAAFSALFGRPGRLVAGRAEASVVVTGVKSLRVISKLTGAV